MVHRTFAILLGVLATTPAMAQPQAPGGAQAANSARALHVVVDLGDAAPEASRVREAIAAELGVPVSATGDAAKERLTVRRTSAQSVDVTFEPERGGAITRSVAAPEDPERLVLVVALLAGNLVRAEANELLAELEARRRATSAPGATEVTEGAEAPPAGSEAEAPPAAAPAVPATPREPKEDPNKKQAEDGGEDATTPPRDFRFFHAAFFHPIAIPGGERHAIGLSIGLLYGHVGGVRGLSLGGGATRIEGDHYGVSVDGLGTFVEGAARGVQVAGFGVVSRDVKGAQVAGFGILSGRLSGVQVAGFGTVTHGVEGVQISGAGNLSLGDAAGVQIGGGANWVDGSAYGLQIAGGANVASGSAGGVQIAGGANVVAERFSGFQLGVVNVGAEKVEGFQLGIVNFAGELDGYSLALATIASNVRPQAVAWWSTGTAANVGAKFTNGVFTTLTSFGYEPEGDNHRMAAGLSLGLHSPLAGALFGDVDVGYFSEELLGDRVSDHSHVVRSRAYLGFAVTPAIELVAGGAVASRLPEGARASKHTPEFFAGVQLF